MRIGGFIVREFDNRKSLKTFWRRHGHQVIGLVILAVVIIIWVIGYRETHPKEQACNEVYGIEKVVINEDIEE